MVSWETHVLVNDSHDRWLILMDLRHCSFGQTQCRGNGNTVQLATKKGSCPLSAEQSKFSNRQGRGGAGLTTRWQSIVARGIPGCLSANGAVARPTAWGGTARPTRMETSCSRCRSTSMRAAVPGTSAATTGKRLCAVKSGLRYLSLLPATSIPATSIMVCAPKQTRMSGEITSSREARRWMKMNRALQLSPATST